MKVEQACRAAFKSRPTLKESGIGSCYSCLQYPSYADIVRWMDDEQTAVCPFCGTDSVIPERIELSLLDEMRRHWFAYPPPAEEY